MPASPLVSLLEKENKTPTIAPNTADAYSFGSDTTPTLEFTGSDEEGDEITYDIQIDTSATFDGNSGLPLLDKKSGEQVLKDYLIPDSNVVTSGWGAEGGPDYTSVDDPVGSPDEGTTAVYTPTADDLFSVGLSNSSIPAGATITNVRAVLRVYPLDPVTNTVKAYLTIGGTDYLSADLNFSDNTQYQNVHADWSVNPATGVAWTVSDLNSLILGIKKIDDNGNRLTQMYIEVTYSIPADAGFANTVSGGDTDPFNSGEKIGFTVQAGDSLAAGTYYWRARAKDPSGSENWSDWTTARSFSISSGTAENDARSARITGRDTANNSRSARITGKDTSNDNRSGRISGRDSANASRGGRITGTSTGNDTRSARITGKETANDTRGARVTGIGLVNDTRGARVSGVDTSSNNRGGRVTGKESVTDTRTGRIAGRAQAVDIRVARVSGRETANASRGGRITGNANVSDARGGRVTGTATASNERGARISGKNTLQESRGGRITGTDNATATREARVSGRATAEDIRAGRVAGKDTKTDAREARVTGSITETDQREARVSGQDIGFDTIGARVAGKETAEDVRGARITGFIFETVFNVRGATITGVRRNPYTKKQAQYAEAATPYEKSAPPYSDSEEKYQARVSPYTGG